VAPSALAASVPGLCCAAAAAAQAEGGLLRHLLLLGASGGACGLVRGEGGGERAVGARGRARREVVVVRKRGSRHVERSACCDAIDVAVSILCEQSTNAVLPLISVVTLQACHSSQQGTAHSEKYELQAKVLVLSFKC